MTFSADGARCDRTELVSVYLLGALPQNERHEMGVHLRNCVNCQQELEQLQSTVDSLVEWPTDVTRPSRDLWDRVAGGIASGNHEVCSAAPVQDYVEPEWEQVAPGIECKLLATDDAHGRVSMLVRLAPGAAYPPHIHAGVEELHLLDGELWIEDRKLYPGDYNRAEPGTGDQLVWSETGCTCVLITSVHDVIR
jgi:anti-sigma factor ChrR (cupin superfamily)